MPFIFSYVQSDITLCRHYGPLTRDDSCQLRAFLNQLDGKLLVDLTTMPVGESMQEFLRVRSLLPQTAFFGSPESQAVCCTLPGKEFYMHEARHFTAKEEALVWLQEDGEDQTSSNREAA
jgi:hypothetical protein